MCLAAAAGIGPPPLAHDARLTPESIVLFGGRDFDPPELSLIKESGVTLLDMQTVRTEGAAAAAHRALEALGPRPLLLHIDLDVLDPSRSRGLPAVDVPAPGGLSWGELSEAAMTWAKEGRLVGLEVTAYNPSKDPRGVWTGPIIDLMASIVEGVQA
jgi:arginase